MHLRSPQWFTSIQCSVIIRLQPSITSEMCYRHEVYCIGIDTSSAVTAAYCNVFMCVYFTFWQSVKWTWWACVSIIRFVLIKRVAWSLSSYICSYFIYLSTSLDIFLLQTTTNLPALCRKSIGNTRLQGRLNQKTHPFITQWLLSFASKRTAQTRPLANLNTNAPSMATMV